MLPNGFPFGTGVAAQVKKTLLERFDLHTTVRLPNGVFAPSTDIPTNLLFFEADDPEALGSCTREIWYDEQRLPEGRTKSGKTKALDFEEFRPLIDWWGDRRETERAWKVSVEEVAGKDFNRDVKNPNETAGPDHQPPEVLVAGIIEKERRTLGIMEGVQALLAPSPRKEGRSHDHSARISPVEPQSGIRPAAGRPQQGVGEDRTGPAERPVAPRAHWADLLPRAAGKFVAVAGEGAFIADTRRRPGPTERTRGDDTATVQYVNPERGPKIYAHRG